MPVKLSIIIVTYNSENQIKDCLNSIFSSTKKIKSEVIIIDNNSQDSTLKVLKKYSDKIRLFLNKKNTGFATGVNQGIKKAKGDYLLLCNPDIVMQKNTIETLISFIDSNKKIGIVAPQFRYLNNKLQGTIGSFPSFFAELNQVFWLYKFFPFGRVIMPKGMNSKIYKHTHEVDWVSGGCMMFSKDVVKKIGGFDEKYFMYLEDVDFCKRANEAGFQIFYVADTFAYHLHRASFKGKFTYANIMEARSLMHYLKKFYPEKINQIVIIKDIIKAKLFSKIMIKCLINKEGSVKEYLNEWRKI